jgi:hypothetical protein
MSKLASVALALVFATGFVSAQPGPKKGDEKKLVTKVYSIKHLIGERGKASGVADADAVIKVLLDTFPQLRDLKPDADGPQIVERDGGKLEIRATAATHADVKDLIVALERLQDVAVDIKAEVIELDAAAFEKFQKALPKAGRGKPGSPILFATGEDFEEDRPTAEEQKALEAASKILKAGRVVQTSEARFINGAEATVSARMSLITFHEQVVNNNPAGQPQFVKEGFKLIAVPVVSADRRFVRFKLTEQSVVLTRMKKRDVGEVVDKQRLVLQAAETEDMGGTASTVIADGGTATFKLAYAPKDKVWLVVLQPTLFIKAEEEELARQRLKRWLNPFSGR